MNSRNGAKYLAISATAVVALAVVAAILLLDAPGVQRQRRLDERRVKDLRSIKYSIDTYWERKKSLPQDLGALEREPGLKTPLKDPQSGAVYSYEITASNAYRLCAVFALDSSDEVQEWGMSRRWSHGTGKQCFDLRPPDKASKDGGDWW